MDDIGHKLCSHLRPLYEAELSQANAVLRVDEPAGSRCPLAVVFKEPLHREVVENSVAIAPVVRWVESGDRHYEAEGTAGYLCEESRQYVYGPSDK